MSIRTGCKKAQLLKLLRKQYVTQLDALRHCGIYTLSQRVSEWRAAGIVIVDKWVITGGGSKVKAYRLMGR